MNLALAHLERGQVPHLEIAKRFLLRIAPESRRDRTEKFHFAICAADPAGMIHVRGQTPVRRPFPPPLVMGDHISKPVALEFYVRHFPELRLDLIPNRVLVERSGRLRRQRLDHREHFLFAHPA